MGIVEVEVARIADREQVLAMLAARRIDAKAVDGSDGWLGIEVPCGDGQQDQLCDDLLAELESFVSADGVPLVPLRANDAIFLRPPGD
jgi:hypothetical protein